MSRKHATGIMRVAAALLAVLTLGGLSGCGQGPAASNTPVLGLRSPGESVTVGPLQYRLDARFAEHQASSNLERLVVSVRVANTSNTTATLEPSFPQLSAYASDGAPRTQYADPQGVESESRGWGIPEGLQTADAAALAPGGWIRVGESAFIVHKGETGLVVSIRAQPGPDVRWLVR